MDPLHQLFDLRRLFELSLSCAHGCDKEAIVVVDLGGARPLHTFHQDLDVAVRHLHALNDVADRAGLIDIVGVWLVDGGVVLGCQEYLPVAGQGFFKRTDAGLAANDERSHHVREDDHVTNGHHR